MSAKRTFVFIAVLLLIALLAPATQIARAAASDLIITEIMYDPNSAEDNWEWIEVYNSGASSVDLSGFVVDDNNSVAHGSANIASGTIPARIVR